MAILMPSPVQCGPLVVGNDVNGGSGMSFQHADLRHSGSTCANRESGLKSAPNPPVAMMTGPNTECLAPSFSNSTPFTAPEASVSKRLTAALLWMTARPSSSSAMASRRSMRRYVII